MVANQAQSVHVRKGIARREERESLGLRVKAVQATVFRANPQDSLIILAEFTYPLSMQPVFCPLRIIFLKIRIETGVLVYAAEIRTNPDATFTIFAQRINSIIGQGVRVIDRTAQMNKFPQPEIINIKS